MIVFLLFVVSLALLARSHIVLGLIGLLLVWLAVNVSERINRK